MFDSLLRFFRPSPPPVPSIFEIHAALTRLDTERQEVDAAMRLAFDRRRVALLRGNDVEVDRLDAEIDVLAREQERAELIEIELCAQAASLPETTP